MALHVDDGGSALPATQSEWDDLCSSAPPRSPYLSWDWMSTWIELWGAGHDLLPLVVRSDSGELVGAAPFYVSRAKERHGIRWLTLIGQRNTYGEYLDILGRPGYEREVAEVVVDHLLGAGRSRWDVLYIQRMLHDAKMRPHLAEAFERRRCRTRTVTTAPSPYLALPTDKSEILSHASKNLRQQVRQARNRVDRLGDVELLIAGDNVDYDEAFDEMIRLHHMRWARGGAFGDEAKQQFFRRFGARLLERGEMFLPLLAVDGKAIAARYDFAYDGKLWCVQGGWDEEYKAARPGMALTMMTLEWGVDNGMTEYDFLAGSQGYKFRWSTGQRELVAFQAANKWTPKGRAYSLARLSPTVTRAGKRLAPTAKRAAGGIRRLRPSSRS